MLSTQMRLELTDILSRMVTTDGVEVSLELFDINGRLIDTWANGIQYTEGLAGHIMANGQSQTKEDSEQLEYPSGQAYLKTVAAGSLSYDTLLRDLEVVFDPARGGSSSKLALCSLPVVSLFNKLGDGAGFLGDSIVNGDLYSGKVMEITQYNHAHHGATNQVDIRGVKADTTQVKTTTSLTADETTVSVANTTPFASFGGISVNTGEALIGDEIVSYTVGIGQLTLTRGKFNSNATTHPRSGACPWAGPGSNPPYPGRASKLPTRGP